MRCQARPAAARIGYREDMLCASVAKTTIRFHGHSMPVCWIHRRMYERWATPFELFGELPGCESCLRPHITLAELNRFAQTQSDTEAAPELQRAKRKLFGRLKGQQTA